MADIVLTTLNAKYIHAAFGPRYLLANLGPLQPRARIAEFDIHQRPLDVAEALLAGAPKIIGLGVYLWNVEPAEAVVSALKRVRPDVKIILGGPEVSHETEDQPIVRLADHVITGEADLKFAEVCAALLAPGNEAAALPKIIAAEPPDLSRVALPYDFYTADDIAHRLIYVEASRGCPFKCDFCLSSVGGPVRQFPLPALLAAFQRLLDRGARQFKFVDRTFNLDIATSRTILEFFLKRQRPGLFLHFEMVPDRLPETLREVIKKFPPGSLQFEVGVQTFDAETARRINRRQDLAMLEDNFRFLRRETGVHIHADLVAGLPGETLESFAAGFDRLIALGPREIQVGILKRLRGAPIARHDAEWGMVYNAHPPYDILQNKLLDFATMQRLRRFARCWDLVGNSGNFVESTPLIWSGFGVPAPAGKTPGPPEARTPTPSSFRAFLHFSDWLFARTGRMDGIALVRLMELFFEYLSGELKLNPRNAATALWNDYRRSGHHDKPCFLKDFLPAETAAASPVRLRSALPRRQARHLG